MWQMPHCSHEDKKKHSESAKNVTRIVLSGSAALINSCSLLKTDVGKSHVSFAVRCSLFVVRCSPFACSLLIYTYMLCLCLGYCHFYGNIMLF